MNRVLVAYFSAGGVTAGVARRLAQAAQADLFEIAPAEPYTPADLNWMNRNSRSSREMRDPDCRPALAGPVVDISPYDVIFLGFPIWWGREPSVVDTFLEACRFAGKRIVPFFTSGGSGFGDTAERIRALAGPGAAVAEGVRLRRRISDADLKAWAGETIG